MNTKSQLLNLSPLVLKTKSKLTNLSYSSEKERSIICLMGDWEKNVILDLKCFCLNPLTWFVYVYHSRFLDSRADFQSIWIGLIVCHSRILAFKVALAWLDLGYVIGWMVFLQPFDIQIYTLDIKTSEEYERFGF